MSPQTVALSVLLCLVGVMLVAAEVPISELVDWSQVPDSTPAARNLNNANLGQCICDLTTNACDPLCCCDADCTAQEVALFASCEPSLGSSSSVPYCFNQDAATRIVRINNPEPLDEVVPGLGAICLVRNNYPSGVQSYFSVPANTAVSDPADSSSTEWFTDKEPSSNFIVGSKVPMIRAVNESNSWKLVAFGSGFLTIQAPGKQGYCGDGFPRSVNFMDPVTSTECFAGTSVTAGTSAAASACSSMDVASTLYQAIRSPSVLSSATVTPILVNIYSASSGILLETVDPTALINGILSTSSVAATRHFQVESVATTTALLGSVCTNAVTRRSLVIAYDASTSVLRVSNATLSIYVSDVDVSAQVTTSSRIVFIRTGAASLPIPRDGNPGFLTGRSVPAGTFVVNGTKTAVQHRYGGFSIPSGGNCFRNKRRSVKFLHSVLNGGCDVTISETQLQSLCADAAAASNLLVSVLTQNVTVIPSFPAKLFNVTGDLIDRIAMTADARSEDTPSWVPITGGTRDTFPSIMPLPYDPYTRQCKNLFIGLHYKIVVARAGSQSNPQDVIVAAFADPILGTWAIRNDTSYDGSATTTNYLKFKVSFVRYGGTSQATLSSVVEPPPLLPKLDDTIFYPFRRS